MIFKEKDNYIEPLLKGCVLCFNTKPKFEQIYGVVNDTTRHSFINFGKDECTKVPTGSIVRIPYFTESYDVFQCPVPYDVKVDGARYTILCCFGVNVANGEVALFDIEKKTYDVERLFVLNLEYTELAMGNSHTHPEYSVQGFKRDLKPIIVKDVEEAMILKDITEDKTTFMPSIDWTNFSEEEYAKREDNNEQLRKKVLELERSIELIKNSRTTMIGKTKFIGDNEVIIDVIKKRAEDSVKSAERERQEHDARIKRAKGCGITYEDGKVNFDMVPVPTVFNEQGIFGTISTNDKMTFSSKVTSGPMGFLFEGMF